MTFSNTSLTNLIIHFAGNKISDGRFVASDAPVQLNEMLQEKLVPFYLHKFATVPERYRFHHVSSLKFNETYNFIAEIFETPEKFTELSKEIAKHLFEQSVHPNIKPGELHIAYFSNCEYDGQDTDVIGIFKTEEKSGYLDVKENEWSLTLQYQEGIDIKKFEKGCLVFNIKKEEGFEAVVIDKQSKDGETQYWMDEFLGLMRISNDFTQTSEVLSITKNYITQQFSEEFDVSRTDKIDLLNRSIDYFKNHQSFDKEEFQKEVFYHPEMIESFQKFDNEYRQQHEIDIEDSFDISSLAVKKQARVFKSVLKLDKNFHIYIHGNKNMIERGVDEDGRKFYKIYYEVES